MASIPAEYIRDGDIIDIVPILDDPQISKWDFGPTDAAALAATRLAAECAYARVDEPKAVGDAVTIHTDLMNFVVPKGYLIELAGD